jgi:drug/metabolite transporter (DMT)-like permease
VFVALALASAVVYGAADFLGGFASRRAHAVVIALVSQLAGLILLALILPWLPASSPVRSDYLWGAASGVAGGAGVALLYRALSSGTMAIVAPTTAVCAVAIPVLVAFALGDRPAVPAIAGIALAVVAIGLVSRVESPDGSPRAIHHAEADRSRRSREAKAELGMALMAGIAIGLFFLCLARTSRDAGLWRLVVGRATSIPLFALLALAGRHSVRMKPRVRATAIGCGALDMLANALYLIATRYGPFSLAVTLSSLYPASTVMLARLTLGERLSRTQAAGVVCALIAVLLIVGSTS